MCPLWPAHYLLMYILIICPLWLLCYQVVGTAAQAANKWSVAFNPPNVTDLKVGQFERVEMKFNLTEFWEYGNGGIVVLEFEMEQIDDTDIVKIEPPRMELNSSQLTNQTDHPSFELEGIFLGKGALVVRRTIKGKDQSSRSDELPVTVLRVTGVLDLAFTYSVAALVAIIYINMGAAVDTRILTETLKKPIGPAIGFFSQFVIMPLLSYGIAVWLIPNASLQLGLFITGCSPGGGASNIWTLTLGGNLDLSITMTTVSTFAAFLMMPLWILTLGATILREAKLAIPYRNIGTFAIALVVPLALGITIQRTLPKAAKFLVRILKPFAIFLIIYIVVFAIYTNLFLFRLFTWQIVVSGILLPWLGYFLGGGLAWILKQDPKDVLAIGIETGVQNTGLAILGLRVSLPAPDSDLATVLPVAVAIMTPVVPLAVLLYQKVTGYTLGEKKSKPDPLYSIPPSFDTELSISTTETGSP